MTLLEWSEQSGVQAIPFTVSVPAPTSVAGYKGLWHLSDYRVSSVVAGTVWRVRINPKGQS